MIRAAAFAFGLAASLTAGDAWAAVQGLPKPGTDPRRRAAAAANQAEGRTAGQGQPAAQGQAGQGGQGGQRQGQRQGQPQPAAGQGRAEAQAASTALYWREEFVYPVQGRRNPFENLAASGLGPDFADLDLVGIIYRPGEAVATLLDRAANKRYRVRRGDMVGNAEILEIRSGEVVFNVTVFGVSRVERLRVKKAKDKETQG